MLPTIRNILFAAGLGNDTGYVFDYALSLARTHGAKIYIIHSHEALNIGDQNLAEIYMLQEGVEDAIEKSQLDSEEKVRVYLEEICQEELKKHSAANELIADIKVSRYAPKAAILKAAEEVDADLILMGSHRHFALGDALLGSTTMKVLHSTRVPVLVVRIPQELPAD
jgi:nucleotide-binding universal stress UspA family protein